MAQCYKTLSVRASEGTPRALLQTGAGDAARVGMPAGVTPCGVPHSWALGVGATPLHGACVAGRSAEPGARFRVYVHSVTCPHATNAGLTCHM